MPSFLQRRSSLTVAIVCIFLFGAAAGFWRYFESRADRHEALLAETQRFAAAFEPAQLFELAAHTTDLDTPPYTRTQQRLLRLQRISSATQSLELYRILPDGKVIFLAGSETPAPAPARSPGDLIGEAARSPGLQTVLATPRAASEGPIDSPHGLIVSGYALIGDLADEQPAHVLRLDLYAHNWNTSLWTDALGTTAYVWLLLVLPLVALVATRRDAEHRDAVRNLTEAMEQGHSAVIIIDLERRIEYANA